MKPEVSIIMPSYNVADYIRRAVNSVRNQTMRNIEIICVDAGSIDGTSEILETAQKEDNRILLIPNYIKSYGKQVNKGITCARGKYIAIVETDDYIAPDMIEELFQYANKYDCDFVKGDYKAFWTQKNGSTFFLDRKTVTDDKLYNVVVRPLDDYSLATSDWYLWTGIYKKEFIVNNKIMFSETPGAAFQDIGFLHKTYVKARRAFYINKSFYYYCIDRVDSSSNIGKGIDFSYHEYQRLFEMDWSQDEETAMSSLAWMDYKEKQYLFEKVRNNAKSPEINKALEKLKAEVRSERSYASLRDELNSLTSCFLISPQKLNRRMVNQDGAFILCGLLDSCAVYLAVVDDEGNERPLSGDGEVILEVEMKEAPAEAYTYYYNEEQDVYEYVSTDKENVDYDTYSFGLRGECNINADWRELSVSPKVIVTWEVKPVTPEKEEYAEDSSRGDRKENFYDNPNENDTDTEVYAEDEDNISVIESSLSNENPNERNKENDDDMIFP